MISVLRKGGGPFLVFLTLALALNAEAAAPKVVSTGPSKAADAPKIELPKEISAEVSDPVAIKATTTGKIIKWMVLDVDKDGKSGIAIFPAELKDPLTTVVICKKPGNWRVMAYTALGDEPSDPAICTIKVAGYVPPGPDPGPGPGPTPGPVDPLTTELQTIYNGLTETDKADSLLKLQSLYAAVPASLNDPSIKTVGQMRAFLVKAFTSVLPVEKIKPIRDRLNTAMYPELPTTPGDPVNVAAVTAIFQKYHKILSGVK